MHALLGYREHSFIGEEQLLDGADGAIAGRVSAIRSIALESGAIEGSYATVVVAGPQQLLHLLLASASAVHPSPTSRYLPCRRRMWLPA